MVVLHDTGDPGGSPSFAHSPGTHILSIYYSGSVPGGIEGIEMRITKVSTFKELADLCNDYVII